MSGSTGAAVGELEQHRVDDVQAEIKTKKLRKQISKNLKHLSPISVFPKSPKYTSLQITIPKFLQII